jgi:DNA (cytosine-5)-methyltransferase 1
MRYISLFSGIGAIDLGLDRAGMTCVAQVENDAAARGVLAAHWPDVPRFDDVRNFGRKVFDGSVDLIAGGFPCQDVSLSGQRAGLAGEQSGLWWQFRRIIRELTPRWVVVENVPGLLSSNAGRDFATVVRGLVKCGYGVVWRVLDSQFFGVAQRRRRVFIVGSLGDGCAAEVLFEPVGLQGNPAPRRKTWEEVTSTLGASSKAGGRRSTDLDGAGAYIVAFAHKFAGNNRTSIVRAGDYAGTISATRQDAISGSFGVRRLTPLECERLQGLPDGWTAGQADSHRYRQLGNAVAVPVVEWIGSRIMQYR